MTKILDHMTVKTPPPDDDMNRDEFHVQGILDRGVVRAMAEGAEPDEALRLGREYVDHAFAVVYGEKLARVLAGMLIDEELLRHTKTRFERAIRELEAQPVIIASAQENGGADGPAEVGAEVPLSRWLTRDLVAFGLSAIGSIAIGAATFLSVKATMEAAELEIFHIAPHLPSALAVMPVAAAVLAKQAVTMFTSEANRTRYRQALTFSGLIAFVVWVPLFSTLYEGVGGVFDPFAEPKHGLGTIFNIVHLLCEPLIGAALFLQADAAFARYAPSHKVPNPELQPWRDEADEVFPALQEQTDRVATATGQRDVLMGIKGMAQTYVETAIRQKLNEKPRDSLI